MSKITLDKEDKLKYDTSLSFDEQEDEVRSFIENAITREPDERLDIAPTDGRPDQFIWVFDDYSIIHHYTYPYAFPCQNQRFLNQIEVVKK